MPNGAVLRIEHDARDGACAGGLGGCGASGQKQGGGRDQTADEGMFLP